jgi:hypothetical protein
VATPPSAARAGQVRPPLLPLVGTQDPPCAENGPSHIGLSLHAWDCKIIMRHFTLEPTREHPTSGTLAQTEHNVQCLNQDALQRRKSRLHVVKMLALTSCILSTHVRIACIMMMVRCDCDPRPCIDCRCSLISLLCDHTSTCGHRNRIPARRGPLWPGLTSSSHHRRVPADLTALFFGTVSCNRIIFWQ